MELKIKKPWHTKPPKTTDKYLALLALPDDTVTIAIRIYNSTNQSWMAYSGKLGMVPVTDVIAWTEFPTHWNSGFPGTAGIYLVSMVMPNQKVALSIEHYSTKKESWYAYNKQTGFYILKGIKMWAELPEIPKQK
jgi:hypothetical protein